MSIEKIQRELKSLGNAGIAAHSRQFFKTGPGEYGEGDQFRGIRVPVTRRIAQKYKDIPLNDAVRLLRSRFHEDRLCALFILVHQFARGDEYTRRRIYELYLRHTCYVNNWDLVDSSAPLIVGPHLAERSRRPLFKLARSRILWERRIAMMATYHFIKSDDFGTALEIAELLLNDKEDLIHKAVGWMLREIGNRDRTTEERFLKRHYKTLPRTMLRYAIERFPQTRRKAYLNGHV